MDHRGGMTMQAKLHHLFHRLLISAAIMFLLSQLGYAQETRGVIVGEVTDATGAVVPKATVTATNVSTSVSVSSETNREGRYILPYLISGVYRVRAEASGFKTAARDQIELRISERLQLDFRLEVGSTSETVVVKADTPLLQTATANLGQT